LKLYWNYQQHETMEETNSLKFRGETLQSLFVLNLREFWRA
jgi:hypothetical protein